MIYVLNETIWPEAIITSEFVKEDRNGTKYYKGWTRCGRCGGDKGYWKWSPWNNGKCFNCNNTGRELAEWKVYTEEYLEKREKKRQAKFEKIEAERKAKADEFNKGFLTVRGFNEQGFAYEVDEFNTYCIKEKIKADGGKWNQFLRKWVFKAEVKGYKLNKILADDIYKKNDYGEYYEY